MMVVSMRNIVLLVLALLLWGCGETGDSPEAQIRSLLTEAEEAAEGRDLDYFRGLIADNYSDHRRRGRQEILELAQIYFVHNRSIRILSRVDEIDLPGPDIAQVKMVAGLARRNAAATNVLDLRANAYRFELEFHRGEDGEWRLNQASWRQGLSGLGAVKKGVPASSSTQSHIFIRISDFLCA